ncbi:hypothetical protein [Clostridioides sp. ES-S-0001-03]|uniref:hypothetical protein n=1 Tax=Clostridioides sp. ES-S-0001-03 TaxID=2770771 RepID=UPI001D0C0DC6|nr:hypothetical protein [Clostridioides sp. ES-S-0001-03]
MEEYIKKLIEHSKNVKELKDSMEKTIYELADEGIGKSGIDSYMRIMDEEIHKETMNVCKCTREILLIKEAENEQQIKEAEKDESKVESFFKKIGLNNK